MLNDLGIVVLNYMTYEETKEMVASLKLYYPDVRTVIVDNGSPPNIVEKLYEYANQYKNVTVLPLEENIGFARGNNAGIKLLREEGYNYICCSNSDIVITESGVLESLREGLLDTGAAISGPQIITSAGDNQNPNKFKRPDLAQAKSVYNKYNTFFGRVRNSIPKTIRLPVSYLKKRLLALLFNKPVIINNSLPGDFLNYKLNVYSLHGAFIMFGPTFFKYYDGFDENTFLFCEEDILGEMLLLVDSKCLYDPFSKVLHKEDKTSNFIWGRKANRMKKKYTKNSVKYWYENYFIKYLNKD